MGQSLPWLSTPFLLIFFLQHHFFVYSSTSFSFSSVHHNHLCPDKQSLALFQFKQTFSISIDSDASWECDHFGNTPSYPKTNQWNMSSDCCKWDGVTCNRLTGDVIGLNLNCSQLVGVLHSNSSLFQLPHLQRLNLAFNDFSGSMIPREFGQFATSLTHLNLSYSNISGPVPSEISHLSKLVSVDLSYNYNLILNDRNTEFQHQFLKFLLQNLTQLRHLSLAAISMDLVLPRNLTSFCSLTFLDLSGTGLRGELPHEIFFLPNLKTLNLGYNPNVTGVLPQSNLGASNGSSITSLRELDLSYNTMSLLSEEVRDIVGSLKSLKSLKLIDCNLSGVIPQFILNLTYLTELDLSENNLEGQIPNGNLLHLRSLKLMDCNLSGVIPQFILNLTYLIELDLSRNNLEGRIPSWVANLSQLVYLDLSYNLVMGPLSSNIIGLQKLTFLDLSASGLSGELPLEIFFLPNLKTLKLGDNPNVTGVLPQSNLGASNGSSITSLRELDLSYNIMLLLSEEVRDIVGSLKSLKSLKLIYCNLTGPFPSWVANLSELVYLDLSSSSLMGPLPSNIIGLQKLTHLHLSRNSLNGTIPSWVFDLPLLEVLDLDSNQLQGQLSEFQFKSNSLETISLSDNELSGFVDIEMFSSQKKLAILSLSYNNNLSVRLSTINNTIINTTFPDLRSLDLSSLKIKEFPYFLRAMENLEYLDLSNTQIHGRVPEWVPSKWRDSLQDLDLSSNFLEESIFLWICNSTSLQSLSLSGNNFGGVLPHCLGNLSDSLEMLDLSMNHFHGTIPSTFANLNKLQDLNLGSNFLDESIPLWICNFTSLGSLNLSSNNFGGVLPHSLGNLSDWLYILDLSRNQFRGTIPLTFVNLINLQILKLQGNQFEGMMPSLGNCTRLQVIDLGSNILKDTFPRWMETLPKLNVLILRSNEFHGSISISNILKTKYPFPNLQVMDLSNNEFRGEIPNVLGTFQFLEDLDLHNNHLQGAVPSSLANCAELEVLNLGKNKINDTFPNWLETLPKLHVLILSFNKFHGPISTNSKNNNPFPKLRIIDLSCNEFFGLLPELYFKNFNAMVSIDENKKEPEYLGEGTGYYRSSVVLVMKGVTMEIERILTTLTTIDLSSNKFKGEIPDVIGNLKFLRQLNLSHNSLLGPIPSLLGNLSVLESLDLNSNQLEGEIPQELINLNSLAKLNLSHNHLSGRIPSGKQFNTFLNDSYYENLALCGFPLNDCEERETTQPLILQEKNDLDFMGGFTWEAVLMGYGCGAVLGFVIGYIIFLVGKPKWFTGIVERELQRTVRSLQKRGYKHGGRRN